MFRGMGEAGAFMLTMIAAYLFTLASVLGAGCASTSTQAKRAAIGISYADEVNACSDKATAAKDLAVYDACMDAVDVRYGLRKPADAGAKGGDR